METASCPHCDGEEKEATTVSLPMTGVNVPPGQKITVQASLDTARIKTAYSCSSKLALAGIIETSEVDSYAEQMLNDDLKADAMIRQTKLLLKSAQASSERVAAAAAESLRVREAWDRSGHRCQAAPDGASPGRFRRRRPGLAGDATQDRPSLVEPSRLF